MYHLMMKFILPTQWSPSTEINLGDLKLKPYGRVKVVNESVSMYWDSIEVESQSSDWNLITEWVTFHSFIFNDFASINWYESASFDFGNEKLIAEGECSYIIDYKNISQKMYSPSVSTVVLDYMRLYEVFQAQSIDCKSLVKNYFNGFSTTAYISSQRAVRDDSFWRILVLFSIIEAIIGEVPKCPEILVCSKHGQTFPHNDIPPKDWIKTSLSRLIPDSAISNEYFEVIWEVRQKIRHKVVHTGAVSNAKSIQQDEEEITWDWARVSSTWNSDNIALLGLKLHLSKIARNLLLSTVFGLNIYTPLTSLKSKSITLGQ